MAVTRKTQKDVGHYQAKLIGPFTVRQAIYIGIGAAISVVLWKIMSGFGMQKMDMLIVVAIVMAPCALLGFANPFGMTCLEFIKQYYEYHILGAKERIYEIQPYETEEQKKKRLEEEKKNKSKSKKKDVKPVHKKVKGFDEYL